MPSVKLMPRLLACALLAKENCRFADVGTDHAYLPIYLCNDRGAVFGIASDIRQGPLDIAKRNLESAGLLNKVSIVLSDGLENVDVSSLDTVFIAGMGGETICRILDAAELDLRHDLILQPMTQAKVLRKYLFEHGYQIEKECLAEETDKIYHIIKAKKTGRRIDFNDAQVYVGSKYEKINDSTGQKFISKEIKRLEKVLEEMKLSKTVSAEQVKETERELIAFKQVKGEMLI